MRRVGDDDAARVEHGNQVAPLSISAGSKVLSLRSSARFAATYASAAARRCVTSRKLITTRADRGSCSRLCRWPRSRSTSRRRGSGAVPETQVPGADSMCSNCAHLGELIRVHAVEHAATADVGRSRPSMRRTTASRRITAPWAVTTLTPSGAVLDERAEALRCPRSGARGACSALLPVTSRAQTVSPSGDGKRWCSYQRSTSACTARSAAWSPLLRAAVEVPRRRAARVR